MAVGSDALGGWARCSSLIGLHRAPFVYESLQPDLPIRIKMISDLVLHAPGESFAKPRGVRPGHCHKVAQPLTRDLMSRGGKDPLPGGFGAILWFVQQFILTVGNDAPGPLRGAEAGRERNLVQLGQWIANAEVIAEKGKDLPGGVDRIPPIVL